MLRVQDLAPEQVRKWFLELILDTTEDICERYGASEPRVGPEEFEVFLRRGRIVSNAVVETARKALFAVHELMKAGKPIYSYTIWVEPVSVTPVVLSGFREEPKNQQRLDW